MTINLALVILGSIILVPGLVLLGIGFLSDPLAALRARRRAR
jgi:hypothetical protein